MKDLKPGMIVFTPDNETAEVVNATKWHRRWRVRRKDGTMIAHHETELRPAIMIGARVEVARFAELMESKLGKNDEKYGGNSWKNSDPHCMFLALHEHIEKATVQKTKSAWADVANFALFMAHHCKD